MTSECTGRGEFAEFVTHHLLSYINRNELVSIMNCDSMSDEVR